MNDYTQLINVINQNIKKNGANSITGEIMNSVLKLITDYNKVNFDNLANVIQVIADSEMKNVIGSINPTIATTNLPNGTYFAQTAGTYTNASNIVVKEGFYTLLTRNEGNTWVLATEVKMEAGSVLQDFQNASDKAFSAVAFSKTFLNQTESNEINVSNLLSVGAITSSNVIDSTFVNWLQVRNLETKGAAKFKYVGIPPYNPLKPMSAYIFLDANYAIISSKTYTTAQDSYVTLEVDIPATCKYISVTVRNLASAGDINTIKLIGVTSGGYDNTIKLSRIENNERIVLKNARTETYCAVGDSITQFSGTGENGVGYTTLLKNYFNFPSVTVKGYSGKSMATSSQGSILDDNTNWTAHDLYSLFCSTNDFKLNTVLGTNADYINNTGRATFYGSLRQFVDRIYVLNPKARILLIGTLQRNNANYTSWSTNTAGNTLRSYIDALKWVANYEALPFVDLFYEANINMKNVTLYTTDGLHPNGLGYSLITPPIIQGFNKILF